jgi:hypothetical protein
VNNASGNETADAGFAGKNPETTPKEGIVSDNEISQPLTAAEEIGCGEKILHSLFAFQIVL